MLNLYNAICEQDEPFDPIKHGREDLKILKAKVFQHEGQFSRAIITIEKKSMRTGSIMFLSQTIEKEIQLIFKGYVSGLPKKLDQDLLEVELLAQPTDYLTQLQVIKDHLSKNAIDSLFYDPLEELTIKDLLSYNSNLIHWDRKTHRASLSCYFSGSKSLCVTDDLIDESLNVKFTHSPIDQVEVLVSAMWQQRSEGEINLFPLIEKSFPQGFIHTLTPKAFKKNWPKEGYRYRGTGYQVLESTLEEIDPPLTGALNIYPRFMKWKITENQMISVPVTWFAGVLNVWWRYRQRRQEVASFNMINNYQGSQGTGKKRLIYKLKNLPSVSEQNERGTFFDTERGTQVLKDAVKQAVMFLCASNRSMEIEFQLPSNMFSKIDLDSEILIAHPQFGEQIVKAKITEYSYIITYHEQMLKVKASACIGKEEHFVEPAPLSLQTEDKLVGIKNIQEMKSVDFIEELEVINPLEVIQKKVHLDHQKNVKGFKKALTKYVTFVRLKLKDLKTYPVLKRRLIYKDIVWTGLKQVDLSILWRNHAEN